MIPWGYSDLGNVPSVFPVRPIRCFNQNNLPFVVSEYMWRGNQPTKKRNYYLLLKPQQEVLPYWKPCSILLRESRILECEWVSNINIAIRVEENRYYTLITMTMEWMITWLALAARLMNAQGLLTKKRLILALPSEVERINNTFMVTGYGTRPVKCAPGLMPKYTLSPPPTNVALASMFSQPSIFGATREFRQRIWNHPD